MSIDKLVLYYANWCHYCNVYKEEWTAIKKILKNNGITAEEYEQTKNEELMKKEKISSYPTLKRHNANGTTKVLQSRDTNYVLGEFDITVDQNGGGGCKLSQNIDDPYYNKYKKYKMKYINLKQELINQHNK